MARIPSPLDAAAENFRDLPALICSDRTFSYHQYRNLVSATAKRLSNLGIGEAERVAVLLPNDWNCVAIIMALLRVRAIACPLNLRTPAQGIKSLLDKIGSRTLITSPQQATFSDRKILDPRELVHPDDARREGAAQIEVDLEQPATIVFTSGSLGTPKAVLHSHGNHYYNAKGSNENIRLTPADRWLLALPLYHVGGLSILFRCLLGGAAVVIPEGSERPEESLTRHGVTHLSAVPTQFYRLLREAGGKEIAAKLRAILLGGAPVPASLLQEGLALSLPLYTSYGLTEMASQVTTTEPNPAPAKLLTSGKTLPHRQVRISNAGEILVKGRTLFKGYVERAGLALPVDKDGWFATGDLGQLDSEGYLTVTGRKDNMFISGGENIQPEEIEIILCEHPAVAQAVVVPVSDEEFGSRPVAFVQTGSGNRSSQELTKFLEQRLARYKLPIAFLNWPENIGSEGLKVSRELFRGLAVQKLPGKKTK